MKFGSWYHCLKQPQKTLVYAKALQHWADIAKPTLLGESWQLVEFIKELREWIEPFTTFTYAQVFDLVEPSNWVQVTPSKSMETINPLSPQKCSTSRDHRARTRGVVPTRGKGHSKVTIPSTVTVSSERTGALNIFTQWVKSLPGRSITQRQMSPPRFYEITRFLCRDDSTCITIDIPPELTTPPGLLAGTAMATMTSMWMCQDTVTGATYVDTVMASMSLISLRPTPMAVDCAMPSLEDLSDSD